MWLEVLVKLLMRETMELLLSTSTKDLELTMRSDQGRKDAAMRSSVPLLCLLIEGLYLLMP